MATKLFGTAPNQAPLNQHLGSMAYQNSDAINVDRIRADGLTQIGRMFHNVLNVDIPEKGIPGAIITNGIKIKTRVPAGDDQMLTVRITGYNYHEAATYGLQLSVYNYSSGMNGHGSISSWGGRNPDVYAAWENGYVVFFIDNNQSDMYFDHFNVDVYSRNALPYSYKFTGWTWEDENIIGTASQVFKLGYQNWMGQIITNYGGNRAWGSIHLRDQTNDQTSSARWGVISGTSTNTSLGVTMLALASYATHSVLSIGGGIDEQVVCTKLRFFAQTNNTTQGTSSSGFLGDWTPSLKTFVPSYITGVGMKAETFHGDVEFFIADNGSWNAESTTMRVAKIGSTGRSINAAGTINAAGADYAEYENNGGLTIAKGAVVGFKADGILTLTYSEAVRFGVKSTDPSIVGGDVWGNEEKIGVAPVEPVRVAATFEKQLVSEAIPAVIDEHGVEVVPAVDAKYATVEVTPEESDESFNARKATYEAEKVEFEASLEAARKKVDRVAYAGKVPVNVTGATAGGYIVAVEGADGSIVGQFVADPDFAQYKKAVGRVNRVLEDGRAEIAVIVH
jgi:hypothetical protein